MTVRTASRRNSRFDGIKRSARFRQWQTLRALAREIINHINHQPTGSCIQDDMEELCQVTAHAEVLAGLIWPDSSFMHSLPL